MVGLVTIAQNGYRGKPGQPASTLFLKIPSVNALQGRSVGSERDSKCPSLEGIRTVAWRCLRPSRPHVSGRQGNKGKKRGRRLASCRALYRISYHPLQVLLNRYNKAKKAAQKRASRMEWRAVNANSPPGLRRATRGREDTNQVSDERMLAWLAKGRTLPTTPIRNHRTRRQKAPMRLPSRV